MTTATPSVQDDDHCIPEHKLSAFVLVVLSLNSPQTHPLDESLSFGTLCEIFDDGPEAGFRANNGIVMSSLDSNNAIQCGGVERDGKKARRGRRKKGSVGVVRGSASVVRQLHVLVSQRCFRISSRVVGVVSGGDGKIRVVVLVDVHLPLLLWSGWQFPKSAGSIAGALFRHLSCDWQQRSLMLSNCDGCYVHNQSIWNLSNCHVLGCELQCRRSGSSKKKLFELHEIFKSVPGVVRKETAEFSRVKAADLSASSGIWELPDDVLVNILTSLGSKDLITVAATCHHLRSLAMPIIPCIKLKLFPHQQTAAEWMLQRERNSEVLPHPLYMSFVTKDGFNFHINSISSEIVSGVAPTIKDFHGGMFCDEPGLGKTITALSLILKTQGTLAEPPDAAQVIWCTHNADWRCGYYELRSRKFNGVSVSLGKRTLEQTPRRGQFTLDEFTPPTKSARIENYDSSRGAKGNIFSVPGYMPSHCEGCCTRRLGKIKRDLFNSAQGARTKKRKEPATKRSQISGEIVHLGTRVENLAVSEEVYNEQWVRCDSCQKWRRYNDTDIVDSSAAWFCSMNTDPSYQSCSVPEESWDYKHSITDLPGFHTKGTSGGMARNVSFFTAVLREHYAWLNAETKKALSWLAKLSPSKLAEMETVGLMHPIFHTHISSGDVQEFHKVFQAFGLTKRINKGGICRWYYPRALKDLALDLPALKIALCEPLDSFRLYLSRATLVVVPSNLVDHWVTQIEKHVRPGQLRVYLWTDHKKPSPHNLAWDYDVVITTFNRLSAEWGPHKRSALMQVHWLRVMLDEGHTLGSSLSLTNKLQMAVSLTASNRWILTGTPTPNTPNDQLSHLQPVLKFLHEEAYGLNRKAWDVGILKPFEAELEEGRLRLLQLLDRCMISARKTDLHTIPPCVKKATFLNFTVGHAKSYNELVVTVRRNILMADWNDPSHVESLLNPKQWKFRSTTIKNVRLSCCVAGHIKVTDAGQDIQETMDILVENGLDSSSEEYANIKFNLLYGGDCLRCKEWCRLPVITPCRHLLCLGCVALSSEKCVVPGCGNLYEMQTPDILTRPENPNPKWPVPKDLIELQPSYKQDDWNPDWQSTSSSKVAYLVSRLKALQATNRGIIYSINDGSCAKDMDARLCSSDESISNLSLHQPGSCRPFTELNKICDDKVIIFSQFLEHIHVIEQQLTIAGIRFVGMYSPMHNSKKMESLAVFQHDIGCMALLMDGSAALGLDLSFVTHVFLMEPIWDRSMEEQVISRAHRMGATRPVHVETLAMRGTIEEQMLEFLQDADECKRFLKEEFVKPDHGGGRVHRTFHDFAESNYLAHISFVRTSSAI